MLEEVDGHGMCAIRHTAKGLSEYEYMILEKLDINSVRIEGSVRHD